MNRNILGLAALLIIMALILCACGKATQPTQESTAAIEQTVTEAPPVETEEPTTEPPYGVNEGEEKLHEDEENPTLPSTVPTEGSDETTEPSSQPTESEQPTQPSGDTAGGISFEDYNNMTPDEQKAFMDSFDSVDAFFEWYNAAKEEYEANLDREEIGNGPADLGGNG